MNMKKFSIIMMMFAAMVLLAACGGTKEKDNGNDNASSNEGDNGSAEVEYVEITHELDDQPVKVKKILKQLSYLTLVF